MVQASCTDKDFVELFETHGPRETGRRLGIGERQVHKRRINLERKLRRSIVAPKNLTGRDPSHDHPPRFELSIPNGCVIVASDAHYWPGEPSTAHRALVRFCKSLKPKAVVMNGDVLDFAAISRHPPIGWEKQPTVVEEIEAAKERLHEIELAAGRGVQKVWTLGNHDARFETRLATVAREYAMVNGVHLRDNFPQWTPCWSVWVNDVVIKHRFKGGVHATHNNTVTAGKSMVTGHLHSLKVTPYTDYTGTRFGVDGGCIADTDHQAFTDYTEDNPRNWRSGFVVLTFRDGRLMWPEVVAVVDKNTVEFRGELISVSKSAPCKTRPHA